MPDRRGTSSNIELRVLRSHHAATVREEVDQAEVSNAIGHMLHAVREALARQGVEPEGAPFARYHATGETVDLEAGAMVAAAIADDGEVRASELPAGPAAIAVHAGPYESLPATYTAIERWLEANASYEANGGPWELYITDPSAEPDPGRWLTEVIFPLRPA